MEKNNKNLWIWFVVVLVVVIIILLSTNIFTSVPPAKESDPTPLADSVDSTEDTSAGSVNVGVSAATISYQNALVKYKDARIQLDATCQANPKNVTYKNGTDIMIDNRAPATRAVKVGSTFSVKAWGFKIVKLSSATLPATWLVDCDQSQNVATILIQK